MLMIKKTKIWLASLDALEMEMQMWVSYIFGSPLDITFHSHVSIEEK